MEIKTLHETIDMLNKEIADSNHRFNEFKAKSDEEKNKLIEEMGVEQKKVNKIYFI